MKNFITSLRVFIIFAILLGLIYPLAMVVISHALYERQANGSLIKDHDKILGSSLIAQEFKLPKYFQSRFSAINYNATDSGSNNFAPSNKKLIERTKMRVQQIRVINKIKPDVDLPADMVLDSASGLDPHISLENALLQAPRVAQVRKIPASKIKKIIYENIDRDFIGIWGQAGVNVLKLNIALDKLKV